MTAATFHPRAELRGAIRDIIAFVQAKQDTCPFCASAMYALHAPTCPLDRLSVLGEHYEQWFADAVEPRRERVFWIDRSLLRRMLSSGGQLSLFCDGLPDDAEIVGVDACDTTESFVRNDPIRLIVESQSFDLALPHERPVLLGLSQRFHDTGTVQQ